MPGPTSPRALRGCTRPSRLAALGLALAAGAALTGCGGGSPAVSASSTAPAPAAPAPPTAATAPTTAAAPTPASTTPAAPGRPSRSAAATPAAPAGSVRPAPCASGALRVAVGGPSEATAGTAVSYLYLTNTGTAACTLDGHPGLSYVAGADGHQVGRAADREGAGAPVALAPGATAHVRVRTGNPAKYDPAACGPTPVRGYRVYPPDQTAAVFVAHPGTGCGSTGLSLLTVGPVVAGRASASGGF